MLFRTNDELKAALGTLSKNLSMETVLSFVEQAEATHFAPLFGYELLEALSQPTADLSADYLALRTRLQASLVHYMVLEAAPYLGVAFNNIGVQEQSAVNSAPARQWVYHNFVDAAATNAEKLLETALVWLEHKASAFPEWTGSDLAQEARGQLLRGAHELGKYVNIGQSRRAYYALLTFLNQVEELELRPLLGDELLDGLHDALKAGSLTPTQKKLLDAVRPALAHRAMAVALPHLAVSITGTGIRLLSDNDGIRQRQAAPESVVAQLSRREDTLATQYWEKLVRLVDTENPEQETQAAELPDNTGKPSFRV